MNKFKEAKLRIEMLEAAHDAIIDTAKREARYSPSEYLDDDYDSAQDWSDPEYLKQHLNTQGQELLKQAQSLAGQIERLL